MYTFLQCGLENVDFSSFFGGGAILVVKKFSLYLPQIQM